MRIISEKIQAKTFIFSLFFIASSLVKKKKKKDAEEEEEEEVSCQFSKRHLIAALLNCTVHVRYAQQQSSVSTTSLHSKALVSFVFTPTTRSERTNERAMLMKKKEEMMRGFSSSSSSQDRYPFTMRDNTRKQTMPRFNNTRT